jgi:hypothetical protein
MSSFTRLGGLYTRIPSSPPSSRLTIRTGGVFSFLGIPSTALYSLNSALRCMLLLSILITFGPLTTSSFTRCLRLAVALALAVIPAAVGGGASAFPSPLIAIGPSYAE